MNLLQKLKHEIKEVGLATFYFGSWLIILVILKGLMLAEYRIHFNGLSVAIVGALILAKVVLLLKPVPLGAWVRSRPALVDVLLRTLLYGLGVFVAILFEKAFEGRHEYGGFANSLMSVFQHADVHHVWVNTICVSGALLGYNSLSIIQRQLGKGGLMRLFLSPLAGEHDTQSETGLNSGGD